MIRRIGGALLAALALALLAAGHARAAVPFSVHGSVEQVYVTGLAANQRMTLVNGNGRTVVTQAADSLGGLLFRNVRPGSGYRVHASSTGARARCSNRC